MSHHYSGPDFGFPHGDARLDFTDLFAFPKPGNPSKSILIMDVHPSVGFNPTGPTTPEPFALGALYEFKVDLDGDLVADLAYRIRFSSGDDGMPVATVRRVKGALAAGTDDTGDAIVDRAPVSIGSEAHVTEAGDYRFFAGWRSDPFFFDVQGALSQKFTGADFFADKDICGIALEIPNAELGSRPVGIWVRTLVNDAGKWIQADRGARPQQEPFLGGDQKVAYLAGEPATDVRFVAVFAHSLEHTGGRTPEDAARAARTLLPDILMYDPKRPASFPNNGRSLTDDVVDFFFPIFSNGKLMTDNVGPHTDFLTEFPYLGAPHNDWSALAAVGPGVPQANTSGHSSTRKMPSG